MQFDLIFVYRPTVSIFSSRMLNVLRPHLTLYFKTVWYYRIWYYSYQIYLLKGLLTRGIKLKKYCGVLVSAG